MAQMNPPDQRFYASVAHPYAAAAVAPTNTDAMRIINVAMDNQDPLLRSLSKTGTRSARTGRPGRRGASFNVVAPMNGSGTAGTAPDMSPLIEAAFGRAPTIVASTSVTYNLSDENPALTLSSYRNPVSADTWDEIQHGAVVDSLSFESSEELAQMTFTGSGTYTVDRPNFASLDADAKGGLGAFPTEPVAPVYNGQEVVGFRGAVTLDGQTFGIQNFGIGLTFNRTKRLEFGKDYPQNPTQGIREISITVGAFEENVAALNAFRHKVYSKVPFDASFVMGIVAGNIWTWNFKQIQPDSQTKDESGPEWIVRFDGMMAHESTSQARDEVQLVIT